MEQSEQLDYHIYKEYQVIQKVGKGTYGVVYKARHKKTSKIVAIKKIIDAFQNLIDAKRTYRELNYLLQMQHPCIVRLEYLINSNKKAIFNEPNTTRLTPPPFDLKDRGSTTDKLFYKYPQQVKHVYAVFQFIQTDLSYALRKDVQLQPLQRKFIAYQLLHGIAYLHRSGIVHRDIKPANILLNPHNLEVKICDFGMARLKITKESLNEGVLTEYVASRWYRPPEGLLGITTCCDSIDLWSVGCLLAELVLKTPLFPGKSTLDQLQLILRCIGMPSSKQIQKLASYQAQQILHKFTFSKRCKMHSLKQILHSCSNQQIDLIMNLLKFDPSTRISAEDALKHQYFNQIRAMNPQIDNYSKVTAKILDFSIEANMTHTQNTNNNTNHGVEHYRMLIDQLQKYAERSTNRSGQTFNNRFINQNIQIGNNFGQNGLSQNDKLKQKSTKQSDYVTLNKHHYLTSTHSLIQDKNQMNTHKEQLIQKTKTVIDQDKSKKMKKKKVLYKADLFEKSEKNILLKKESKKDKEVKNIQHKQKKEIAVAKKSQSLHKVDRNQSLHRNKSTKSIKQKRQSVNQKKFFLYIQTITNYKKKASENSKSLAKSSSFHRIKEKTPSKEKTFTKCNLDDKKHKQQQVKRFMKPSLNLNKGAIMKIKSSKYIQVIKKNC